MQKRKTATSAESIILLSRRFESIASKYVFKPMGLSPISMKILRLLNNHTSLTASDMIKLLGVTKSNLSQRLNFLEKEGHLLKNYGSDKKDKRKISLRLTSRGKKTILAMESRFKKAQISFEKNFTPNELAQQRDFFEKIEKILDREEDNLEKIFKL